MTWGRANQCEKQQISKRDQSGFSLLELLIAISITGLMASFMYVDLRFSVGAWESGEAKLDQMAQITAVQEFLRGRFEKAYPLMRAVDDDNKESVAFQGAEKSVSMVVPLPSYLVNVNANFYEISIQVGKQSNNNKNLLLTLKPLLPLAEGEEIKAAETVLLENIYDVEFRYFGTEESEDENSWQDEWQEQTKLPLLTSMTVHFQKEDERKWPVLTVAHRINIDGACQFNLNSKQCENRK
ncbi:MAG: prepilin-type N-terminal cleavage/methylation domain-containing protein [Magnetococcales bacterium]|nr:prepilin-type N-terminal cleavage/methylation domain-containing protein [Magnetococcales bacterium]